MKQEVQSYQNEQNRLNPSERETMIKDYLPLVRRVAHRIARHLPSSVEVNDLISAGCVGLLFALERFDPERGLDFGTFAEFRIKGAILDNLRALDPVPRRSRQRMQQMEKVRRRLTGEKGRPPSDDEMAENLELTLAEYHKLIAALTPCMEMSTVLLDHGGSALKASKASSNPCPHTSLKRKEMRRHLVKAIRKLPEKERTIISLYYYARLSYKEIALLFDVTESRICQIHREAVRKMRPYLEKEERPIHQAKDKRLSDTSCVKDRRAGFFGDGAVKGGEVTPPPPIIPKAIRNLGRVRPQKNEDRKRKERKKTKDDKRQDKSDEQDETEQQTEKKDPAGRGKVVDVVA